jgi:hypothetical protein
MDNDDYLNNSYYGSRWSFPRKAKTKEELLTSWTFGPLVLKETPNEIKNVELFLGININ